MAGAALACALLWITLRLRRPQRVQLCAAAELGLGASLGALALACRLFAPAPAVGSDPVAVRVLEPPLRDGSRCSLVIWIGGAQPGRAELLASGPPCSWLPGQLALARMALSERAPRANPGGGDGRRSALRRGIRVRATLVDGAVAAAREPRGPAAALERLRRALGEAIDPEQRPSRAGATLRALITGDRTRLTPEVVEAFVCSGTAHLLAVSGLNVSFVFLLTQLGVEWTLARSRRLAVLRRVRTAALWAGCGAAALYCAVAGFGVPALRAAAMAVAGSMALLGGRPAARWNALAGAALFVLALDPASLFSAALLLSFAAVAGLLLWEPPGGGLAATLHATLAAGFATAPCAAALGLPLPAGTLAANLIAVPWFSALVALGLAVALGALACPPLAPALQALGRLGTELGLRFVETSTSPDLLQLPAHPLAAAILVSAAAFALRLLLLGRRPAALACASLACAAATALVFAPEVERRGSGLVALAVGHGDAVLVYSGERALLVDAGPRSGNFDAGQSIVLPALRARGVRALDVLLVTHADLDHIGGVRAVLRGIAVRELWISAQASAHPAARGLLASAAERAVPVRLVGAGDGLRLGALDLELLWPPRAARAASPNEGSVVLRVRSAAGCALLPGDAPRAVELTLLADVGPCDVLKLAHHGSRTSSAPEWIARLDPAVAIASAGRRTRGPLPHPEVRAALAAHRVALYETARDGAIEVRFTASGPVVIPFRSGSRE